MLLDSFHLAGFQLFKVTRGGRIGPSIVGTRDEVVLVVRAGLNVHLREPQTHKQLMGGGLGVVLEVVVGEGPPGVVPDVIRR